MNSVLANLKDIAEAVMRAAEAGTLEQVLAQIAFVTQQLIHARYTALGVPDGTGSLRFFKVVGVTPAQIQAIGHYPVGRGLLGVIMHERQPLRLERMSDDPRSVGFPANHPRMDRLLGVPIALGPNLYGMLYLCDREDGEPFTEQDQWLVETLAGYAALAIAGVQLSEQTGRLVLLEERERVGRELHDGTIQSLYAIGMQLQLMRLSQPEPDPTLPGIIHDLDNVIEDIRRYILNLKVTAYEQQSLRDSLDDVVTRLHLPAELQVSIEAPSRQPPFPPPVLESVCQIAYEALSNVIRHAHAQNVRLITNETESTFQLVVEDNGSGFDMQATSGQDGLGLRNIQQRARILGGTIQIQSVPGAGTRLTLTLPLTGF
jgi:signal transduction histidine kinase